MAAKLEGVLTMNGRSPLLLPIVATFAAAAQGAVPTPPPVDPAFDRYTAPARLVHLAKGRDINQDCRVSGTPTIVLFPGLSSWSEVWVKVHEPLAQHHRVCAFDPAGFGFSGPSPAPQDAAHIVEDLEATLAGPR